MAWTTRNSRILAGPTKPASEATPIALPYTAPAPTQLILVSRGHGAVVFNGGIR